LIERLETKAPTVATYLKGGRLEEVRDDVFVVVFAEDERFHATCLEKPRHRTLVEESLGALAGRPLQLVTRIEAGEANEGKNGNPGRPSRRSGSGVREARERALADPVVSEIIRLFDGRLVDVQT
jgi:hypothetical protein